MAGAGTESAEAGGIAAWPLGPLGIVPRGRVPRVGVLGLARSGVGAAQLLLARGCEVELLDLRSRRSRRRRSGSPGGGRRACSRIGPHDPAWLDGSRPPREEPRHPRRYPLLSAAARRRGVPVISELELAFLAARGPVLAVTGTNGKSTTTAWAGDMLREAGLPAQVVGNIGRPFSEGVLEDPDAVFVCEVSSFQLEDVRTFRPRVGALAQLHPGPPGPPRLAGGLPRGQAAPLRPAGGRRPRHHRARRRLGARPRRARPGTARPVRPRGPGRGRRVSGRRDARAAARDRGHAPGAAPASGPARTAQPGERPGRGAGRGGARGARRRRSPARWRASPGCPIASSRSGRCAACASSTTPRPPTPIRWRWPSPRSTEPVILIAGGRDKGQDFRPLRAAGARRRPPWSS